MLIGGGIARATTRCVRRASLKTSARAPTAGGLAALRRRISSSTVLMHGDHDHDHDHEPDFVPIGKNAARVANPVVHSSTAHSHDHGHDHDHDHDHHHDHHESDDDSEDEDELDMEDTVALGPSGLEYGGPQRGGKLKEPTRFGDWERKGRCTDF